MQLATLALSFLALPLAAQSQVFVVPGPEYTNLQPALDGAPSGSTILLTAPSFPIASGTFSISGKSLVVQPLNASGALVQVLGGIDVRNLGPDDSVILEGLRIQPQSDFKQALRLISNQGTVLIENCHVEADAAFVRNATPGLHAIDSAEVIVSSSTLVGTDGITYSAGGSPSYTFGSPGVIAEDSQITLFDCDVHGGRGTYAEYPYWYNPLPAGAAVELRDSSLSIVGGEFTGGAGAAGLDSSTPSVPCTQGGAGADSIDFESGVNAAVVSDAMLIPGAAGPISACSSNPPLDGNQVGGVALSTSSATFLSGNRGSLSMASNYLEAPGTLDLNVSGEPGDWVLLYASGDLDAGAFGLEPADWLLGLDALFVANLGPLDGSGSASFNVGVGSLSPAVTHLALAAQGVLVRAAGPQPIGFTSPASIVLLPSGFWALP